MSDRHIELDSYNTSFDLPEVITARLRLAYRGSVVQTRDDELFMLKRWRTINQLGLIQNWQSELWPDLGKDILDAEDPQVANLVIAVVNAVFIKMEELDQIPKK